MSVERGHHSTPPLVLALLPTGYPSQTAPM